jgi:hypothetical protein
MSTETVRGVPVHDWQGSTFDPSNLRFFSILPDCDADEAHCVRHEQDIPPARIVLRYDGALYTTADNWDIYSCPDCYRELGPKAEPIFRQYVGWVFRTFDDPDTDALNDAFTYVGEAGSSDVEPGVSVDE